MKTIVVSGVIANKHRSPGAIWTRLNWTLGFRKLGFDVYFVEEIAAAGAIDRTGARCLAEDSVNLATFCDVMERFDMANRCALLTDDHVVSGIPLEALEDIASSAEALINISGHLARETLLRRFQRKVYVDLDPGFTQIWEATGVAGARLAGHDFFFTIGGNIGRADCLIPMGEYPWRPTRQAVVLDLWPSSTGVVDAPFRTIASWRGPYGPLEYAGQRFGLKAHEWRKFLELPKRSARQFEIALDIHTGDQRDRDALLEHGWKIVEPQRVAGDLDAVQRFIRESAAEFSVAQGVYVGTNSGWVSDRTVCYLASGRPALVQETGFRKNHASGAGLVPFTTLDEAVDGADEIIANYEYHCRCARELAERDFDSDRVLGELIAEIGISP
jgi:hypothetical protein